MKWLVQHASSQWELTWYKHSKTESENRERAWKSRSGGESERTSFLNLTFRAPLLIHRYICCYVTLRQRDSLSLRERIFKFLRISETGADKERAWQGGRETYRERETRRGREGERRGEGSRWEMKKGDGERDRMLQRDGKRKETGSQRRERARD